MAKGKRQSFLVALGYVADERGMVIAKNIYDFKRACTIAKAERDKQRAKNNEYAVVRVLTPSDTAGDANIPHEFCRIVKSFYARGF